MTTFQAYRTAFPHAQLSRSSDGVLEVMLHTNGDTLVFNGHTHESVGYGLALEGLSALDVARSQAG